MKISRSAASLLLILCLLTGCTPSSAPRERAETQTLRVGIGELSGIYDPFWYSTSDEQYVQELMFDYLVSFDAQGTPQPGLADWTVSADGTVYTFSLRDDLHYSDGSPVLASDFAFALEVYADPAYDGYCDYSMLGIRGFTDYRDGDEKTIVGVKAPDEQTLIITLEQPNFNAAYDLALPAVSEAYYGATYEKGSLDGVRAKAAQPMGSGQYILADAVEGQSLTLTANPTHYRGAPKIETVVFSVTPPGMELERMRLGETDLACTYAEPPIVTQAEESDFLRSFQVPAPAFAYIGLNTALPMFADAQTRQALACAVDRAGVTALVYGEYARVLCAPVSGESWANWTEGLDPYAFDLTRAASLLAAAGWEQGSDGLLRRDGTVFDITFLTQLDNPVSEALALSMADSFGRLGIRFTAQATEFGAMYDRIFDGSAQMWMGSVGLLPNPGVYSLYHSSGYQNYTQYASPDTDLLVEQAERAAPETRQAAFTALWQRLNAELPAIFLYQRNDLWVANRQVTGLYADSYNSVFRTLYRAEFS